MIYTTGTIAISGNTLTGTGTNFTAAGTLIRNGCTVIALTSPPQVFQITAIGGATSLTVTPAANPAIPAGTKYSILLSDSLSVDGLAQDIAETFTMYQRYMSGFADVMNGTTDVTITINGVAVTVPGQKSLAKKGANSDITSLSGLTTALSISQGGTGGATAAAARTSLNAVGVGDYGLGGSAVAFNGSAGCGFAQISSFPPTTDVGTSCVHVRTGGYAFQIAAALAGTPRMWVRNMLNSSSDLGWRECYTTGNTTKASDGTLKAASPVARIVKSRESSTRIDIAEEGFSWCGCGTANAEAEGISISRTNVGVYILTGSEGLASEGWQLLPPMDPGGMGELGIVEAEQADNGELTIRLFKRKYMLGDDGEIVKTKGEPIDVPANSWIDVRLDMPESSIWNRHRKQEIEADNQIPGS